MHQILSVFSKLHSNYFKKNDGVTAVSPTCCNWMMPYSKLYENSNMFQASHSSMANVVILILWYVCFIFHERDNDDLTLFCSVMKLQIVLPIKHSLVS